MLKIALRKIQQNWNINTEPKINSSAHQEEEK